MRLDFAPDRPRVASRRTGGASRCADGIVALGPPDQEATDTGAIVHRGQYDKVLSYLQIGRDEGARVVAGGGPPDDKSLSAGMFVRPTLFTDVAPDSRLAQEEIFGPVLAVIAYDTYEDAIEIANGIQYGLTASIFTGDLRTAHRFARDVQAGYVWVNDSARHFPESHSGASRIPASAARRVLTSWPRTRRSRT